MEASCQELEEQLVEVGKRLAAPPLKDVEELLALLDQTEILLSRVQQSPSESMLKSLHPASKALVAKEFLGHSDRDIKVAAVACLNEITRITAPEMPYNDDEMKEFFQSIVEAFENLDDVSSRSYTKRITILETVARVRSCVVMLDLECDDLILEMFRLFLKIVRTNHAANVFSSMEIIMTLVLEESEDISRDLISCLLESVKVDDGMSLEARRLGEHVIKNCADKLKPYLKELLSHSMSEYSQVVASICLGTAAATMENENNVSGEPRVEDSKLSERTISDEFPQESAKTEQEVGYPDEHAEAAEKSSKPSITEDTVCIGNGELDVEESSPKEKPEVSCPSDLLKMSAEADRGLDCVDTNPDLVQDKLKKATGKKTSSVQIKDTSDHPLDVHLDKVVETSDKDGQHFSEAATVVSKVPSPVHVRVHKVPSFKSNKTSGNETSGKEASSFQKKETADHTPDVHVVKEAATSNKDGQHSSEAVHVGRIKILSGKSKKATGKEASSVQMKDPVDRTLDAHNEKEAETSDKDGQHSSEIATGVRKVPSPVHVGRIKILSGKSEKASGKEASSVQMKDAVGQTLDVHHEKEAETSDEDEQHSSEEGTGVSKIPSPIHSVDPDTIEPKRARRAKSVKRRGRGAVAGDLASSSGRKEAAFASKDKSKKLPSKSSDPKKETDGYSDSERRPLKQSGKKSQPADTDQTPEKAEGKSRRQTIKSGSSSSKISEKESSQKQQKLKEKQKDKLKPKKDVSEQEAVKVIISSPKLVKKSKGQDNLEESSSTLSRRKRARDTEEGVETPARNKLGRSIVGSKIKVWWPVDKKYYEGVVDSYEPSTKRHKILYTDGDIEVLLLEKEKWKFLDNELSEGIATEDDSLYESCGKKAKTITNSAPKDANTEASHKSDTGSGSVAKRKGRPPKVSPQKFDELHDDNSPKATNKTVDKTASRSVKGGSKSGTKLSKHYTSSNEKLDSIKQNSLLDDGVRPSKKSHDETDKTHSKKKYGSISTDSSKVRRLDMRKEKLFEETPKAGQRSRSSITPKHRGESKANGTSVKGKYEVQETESSVHELSGKDKVLEKEALSRRKRKRKGQS